MKATLTANNGVEILVWREGELFAARQADAVKEPQICLGVDLFEVLADLAGLDLDDRVQASEALALAEQAQSELTAAAAAADGGRAPHAGAQLDASEHG
jgi:hypothetical protein